MCKIFCCFIILKIQYFDGQHYLTVQVQDEFLKYLVINKNIIQTRGDNNNNRDEGTSWDEGESIPSKKTTKIN